MSVTTKSDAATSGERLNAAQLTSYGFLTMPLAMAGLALLTYLPTFFAIDKGLGLAVVGGLFVAGRLLDIVTDPLIGHWSDRTRTRFGARKPWMVAGVFGFAVSCWWLFVPPGEVYPLYLVLVGTAYFIFATMLDVPYSATGLEISRDVNERSRLAGSKAAFQVLGALLAGAMPALLATTATGSLSTIALCIIALAGVGLVLFVVIVPERPQPTVADRPNLFASLCTILSERRYLMLIGPFFIVQMANAFFSGLAVLYITYVVKAPELVGVFIGLMFLATALFLPLWLWLAARHGKARCWQAGIVVSMVGMLAAPLVGEGNIVGACLVFAIVGATFGCDAVMPTSMLADIAYDREQDGGGRQSGVYLALKNAISKLSFVAPMGIAFPILGMIGFEDAASHDQTDLLVFLGFFSLIPVLLKFVGVLVLRLGPDFVRGPQREELA